MQRFNGLTKFIMTSLVSIILTIIVAWFTFGQGTVTHAQAQGMVDVHAELEEEKHKQMCKDITGCRKDIDKVIAAMDKQSKEIAEQQRKQAKVNGRTEAVVERLEKALDRQGD